MASFLVSNGSTIVPDSMLLVLPVPFRQRGTTQFFESQACNGLLRWADNFSHVTAVAPLMPESLAAANKTMVWEDTAEVLDDRITCIALPWAYSLPAFVREYWGARKILSAEIKRHEYLQFAIGGLWGDWASVAAREAYRQGRPYAVHTDRVESQLVRKLAENSTGLRALKMKCQAAMMWHRETSVISRCAAGLWHGLDCFDAYSPWCPNSHLIHDVHTKGSDAISSMDIRQKLQDVLVEKELRVVYAGRMSEMKAPLEWLKAVSYARDLGISIQAVWYGDGEMRPQMQAEVARLKLEQSVSLKGFISDRKLLLQGLRDAHIMLFTHITPESPRCLLESLICGTPIIGYDNPFACDLTAAGGGGSFVPMHDWQALGARMAELASHRDHLQRLIQEAAANGSRFNDEDVFRERSVILKTLKSIHSPRPHSSNNLVSATRNHRN